MNNIATVCVRADTGNMEDEGTGVRVRALMVQISSMIKGPSVVQRLYGILHAGQVNEIIRLYNKMTASKATFRMVECLLNCSAPGKWQAFIEALQKEGYSYLISLIDGQHDNTADHAKKVLQVFAPYLELQINPECLVDSLRAEKAIADEDVQTILACQAQHGAITATAILLDRLQDRLRPNEWYITFLKVLHRHGYKSILREMEPDFTLDCEVLKCPPINEIQAVQDVEEESTSRQENTIADNVNVLLDEIVEKVEPASILPCLRSELFSENKSVSFLGLDNVTMKQILAEISRIKLHRKWRIFVECLRKADYPDIAQRLVSEDVVASRESSTEQWIIGIYNAILQSQINPESLLVHLVAEGTINDVDKQEIQATHREHGCSRAAGILIQRMQCRQSTRQWYSVFLKTLIKCQQEDLAKLIDPDFCEKHTLQENLGLTETRGMAAHCDTNMSAFKNLEKMVNQQELAILSETGLARRKLQHFRCKVRDMEAESIKELEQVEHEYLHPINKAKSLCQQYRDGDRQDIACLKRDILDCLKSQTAHQLTVHVVPFFDLDQFTKLAKISADTTKQGDSETKIDRNDISESLRHRKYSSDSFSSNSTGFVKIHNSRSKQTFNSDSSISSSRDRSPSPQPCKVSFKEPIGANLHSILLRNMQRKLVCHRRSSSWDFSQSEPGVIKQRKRTLSEKSILEEKDDDGKNEEPESISRDNSGWIDKRDLQEDISVRVSYNKSRMEMKMGRKRLTSESGSMTSCSSVLPLSTSSQDNLSGYSSPICHVTALNSDISSDMSNGLILHGKHCIHSGKRLLTDVIPIPSGDFVVIDHKKGDILVFDEIRKQFKRIFKSSGKFKPFKMVWQDNNVVYVLMKAFDSTTKLNKLEVEMCSKTKSINQLKFLANIEFSCSNQIGDLICSGEEALACCFNKHIHSITNSGYIRVLELGIDFNDWWPNSIAIQIQDVYIYDFYSQRLFCFNRNDGAVRWDKPFLKEEGIEGIAIYGTRLYLAQIRKDKIVVLNIENHNPSLLMSIWSEDVKNPFALCATKTGLLMTQFRENQHRVNRTVKCF